MNDGIAATVNKVSLSFSSPKDLLNTFRFMMPSGADQEDALNAQRKKSEVGKEKRKKTPHEHLAAHNLQASSFINYVLIIRFTSKI